MKQRIGSMLPDDVPVGDINVVFCTLYNLLAEKLEQEPNKGIIVCKGKPNARKVKWAEVMKMAHAMEDFFIFRQQRTGCRECGICEHWKSVSQASPHMGKCLKRGDEPVHIMSSCRKFKQKGVLNNEFC